MGEPAGPGAGEETTELPPGRMTAGIIRRGDRIWRPAGPWSPAVHEYLRHLEAAGFEPGLDLAARLRLFATAYGLAGAAPLVPELARCKLAQAAQVRYWPPDAAVAAGKLAFLAGELRWIHSVSAALAGAG